MTEFKGPLFSTVFSLIFYKVLCCPPPLISYDLLILGGPVLGVQEPFRFARYSPFSWQQWARFPVLRLEGPPLRRSHNPLNEKKIIMSGHIDSKPPSVDVTKVGKRNAGIVLFALLNLKQYT